MKLRLKPICLLDLVEPLNNNILSITKTSETQQHWPLLLMQQREEWASRNVLSDNSKLAGVIQTRSHEMNDTGMIEAAQYGDFSAEHIHIWFRTVRVGSVAAQRWQQSVTVRQTRAAKSLIMCQMGRYRLMATTLFLHLPLYTLPKDPGTVESSIYDNVWGRLVRNRRNINYLIQ